MFVSSGEEGSVRSFQNAFGLNAGVRIAILDENLNPNPKIFGELPNLQTLASLDNNQILFEYFRYLESFLKNSGYIQCVLPKPSDSNSHIDHLLQSLKSYNPAFFLFQSDFGVVEKLKRTSMQEAIADHNYLVVDKSELATIHKKLERFGDKIEISPEVEHRIKWLIAAELEIGEENRRQLPKRLAVSIARGSVIPLQQQANTFPIVSDTICLLTDEPYGAFANMLRKYTYLKTTYPDIRNSASPVILDGHSHIPSLDILSGKQVIYIGEIEGIYSHQDQINAALVYSQKSEIFDYVIPQQLFGAVDLNGKLPVVDSRLSPFWDVIFRTMPKR